MLAEAEPVDEHHQPALIVQRCRGGWRRGRGMAALGAGYLGDLGVHQLGHDLEGDRGRGRQQPFAHVLGKGVEVAVAAAG